MTYHNRAIRNSLGLILCGLLFFVLAGTCLAASERTQPNSEDYTIGKSDVLEINVWKEEELTRTVKVRTDGKISLPLIDDVQAAGRTPMQLKDAIQGRLSDFIEGPTVTVIVQSQVSKKYYLIGEVPGQGEYPLLKDMTIVQALAKASGFTEWADKDEILIFRRSNGQEKRIEVDYEEIVSGDEGAKNILLQAGDTIVVQ